MPLNCRKINFHGKRSSEKEVPRAETLQNKKKQQQAKPVVWAVWKSFQSSFTLIYEVLCYGCKLRHMFDILWSTIKLLNVIEKANSRHFICVWRKEKQIRAQQPYDNFLAHTHRIIFTIIIISIIIKVWESCEDQSVGFWACLSKLILEFFTLSPCFMFTFYGRNVFIH